MSINVDETKDLIENHAASKALSRIAFLFVAFSIGFTVHSAYTIVKYLTDRSVPLVVCPRSYNLDAPILLQPVRTADAFVRDRWIRAFMRRFITSSFPRVSKDIRPFWEYVASHSTGTVMRKYRKMLNEEREIAVSVDAGYHYSFYPKSDTSAFRIRPSGPPNEWTVEVDGFMVKRLGIVQERYSPTLRYKVSAVTPDMDNPEGLVVTDGSIEQITDYVTGSKEKL
jgi:hypothetical protein